MSIATTALLDETDAAISHGEWIRQLTAEGLHPEAFKLAVRNGLNLVEFKRAVRNGLEISHFSPLLEFGYATSCVNDALEIANNLHENIPDHQCRIGRRQFRGDIDTYLERIWLLGRV